MQREIHDYVHKSQPHRSRVKITNHIVSAQGIDQLLLTIQDELNLSTDLPQQKRQPHFESRCSMWEGELLKYDNDCVVRYDVKRNQISVVYAGKRTTIYSMQ